MHQLFFVMKIDVNISTLILCPLLRNLQKNMPLILSFVGSLSFTMLFLFDCLIFQFHVFHLVFIKKKKNSYCLFVSMSSTMQFETLCHAFCLKTIRYHLLLRLMVVVDNRVIRKVR